MIAESGFVGVNGERIPVDRTVLLSSARGSKKINRIMLPLIRLNQRGQNVQLIALCGAFPRIPQLFHTM